MFDADKGNQKVTDHVDELTDEFAALFSDLKPRQQQTIMSKMNELMSNPDSIDAFSAGNYAQNSSGQPAQALGAGSGGGTPTPNDLQEALNVIMSAPAATAGQKAAMTRIFFPGPDHMDVEDNGTPKELVTTRKERDDAKNAKKAAEDKLAEEQDENKSGSLAHQLKAAKATPTATPATPADMVAKADVKPLVDELETLAGSLSAPMGAKVKNKKEVTDKVAEIKAKVS
jgi:hypothetical protein